MANEITVNMRLDYSNGGVLDSLVAATGLGVDVATNSTVHKATAVGASEAALDLGGIATLGYFIGIHRSASGTISIRRATGESDFVDLKAGDVCCFRFSGDATAPFVISDDGLAVLEYLLISA